MNRYSQTGLAAILLCVPLAAPGSVSAQKPAGQSMVAEAPAHPQASGPQASAARPMRSTSTRTRSARRANAIGFSGANGIFGFNAATGTASLGGPITLQQLLDPVPPFGFNYEFLSAIDRNLAAQALIDPATQARLAIAERLSAISSGFGVPGFFLLDGGGAYVSAPPPMPDQGPADAEGGPEGPAGPMSAQQQQQQPQVIVVQMPATQAQQQGNLAAEKEENETPLPDVGEFTLVLRNGAKVKAVAFTLVNDRVVYITRDGGRRSFPASQLDPDATEEINEESGTPVQLPM
jgi:hypothetical protein